MSELKTLKDLDLVDHKDRKGFSELFVRFDEIQQEAIKWVKDRMITCRDCTLNFNSPKHSIICKEHKFWMERFNLTEEDLK